MEKRETRKRTLAQLFSCSICMQDCDLVQEMSFKSCEWNHTFCSKCVKSYAKLTIEDGGANIKCPQHRCSASASSKEIKHLVSKKHFKMLLKNQLKLDPDFRECGACARQLRFEGKVAITCKCGVISCFEHGNTHPDETCAQFVNRTKYEPLCLKTTQVLGVYPFRYPLTPIKGVKIKWYLKGYLFDNLWYKGYQPKCSIIEYILFIALLIFLQL